MYYNVNLKKEKRKNGVFSLSSSFLFIFIIKEDDIVLLLHDTK